MAAVRSLKQGGRLVYSTCSLSPLQNDEVVDRLLARANGGAADGGVLTSRAPAGAAAPAPGASGAVLRVLPAADVLAQELGTSAGHTPGNGAAQDGAGAGPSPLCDEVMRALGAEPTRHGLICLPDKAGWGPIYVAVLERGEGPEAGGPAAQGGPSADEGSADEEEGMPDEEAGEG
jgi:16S rRNA C967 or C1407 C5-methylase (RsmB/RsmF family)